MDMRLLIIGTGGVGTSVAKIIKRAGKEGEWAQKVVLSDYNVARAETVAKDVNDPRFVPEKIDARDPESIKAVVKKHDITWVLNTVEPEFNETIFDTCYELGIGYMDCAMTLSKRHPEKPFELAHIKLGDYQFERHEAWKEKGIMALVGSGVEPGMADVFAAYAQKHLFDEIDEVNVRDGDNYEIPGYEGVAFGFSVWTTIEECLNPPVVWEKGKGWFTTENFSEPEIFSFPGGIGDIEVINVEHEEVMLVPRVIDCNRVTFKYGVPREMRQLLLNLRDVGMAEAEKKIKVGDAEIAPRDLLVKVVPDPQEVSKNMIGEKGCAGYLGYRNERRPEKIRLPLSDCGQPRMHGQVRNQLRCGSDRCKARSSCWKLIAKDIWYLDGVHGPRVLRSGSLCRETCQVRVPRRWKRKIPNMQRCCIRKHCLAAK